MAQSRPQLCAPNKPKLQRLNSLEIYPNSQENKIILGYAKWQKAAKYMNYKNACP